MTSKIKFAVALSSMLASGIVSADSVMFHEIPFDGDIETEIDVSNDGVIAFGASGNGLYKWSEASGVQALLAGDTTYVYGREKPGISGDGRFLLFGSASEQYMFNVLDGSEVAEPRILFNDNNLTGFVSGSTFATGSVSGWPSVVNLETNERTVYTGMGSGSVFKYIEADGSSYILRDEGNGNVLTFHRSYDEVLTTLPYDNRTELPLVSDNGQKLVLNDLPSIGSETGCQISAWWSVQCTKIYNAQTLTLETEIKGLLSKDLSADGSVIVGFGLGGLSGLAKEPYVWDATNGTRSIFDLLEASGVDTSQYDFSDDNSPNRTLVVSPDGSKIAGTLIAADGERTPFMIELGSGCSFGEPDCASEAQPNVMVGAFIDGNAWDSSNISEFNVESNLDLAFVNFFASMSGRFDWHHREQMNKIVAQGAVPMMSFEPKFWDGSVTGQAEIDILQNIAAGAYDENFRKWINGYGQSWEIGFRQWIETQPEGSTIMYRFAHEMNGGWYPWGLQPENYVAAWKHLHDLFEAEGVNQYIQWVWCPNETSGDAAAYYPGDEYVDWTCIDTYNWGSTYSWSSWRSFKDSMMPSYNFLVSNYPTKPIIVGEFGSYEPADLPGSNGGDDSDASEDKNLWKEDMARDLETDFPAVRAISIFNLGTFRMYGNTFQGNPATGIDGWNLGLDESYFTSDYFSVK